MKQIWNWVTKQKPSYIIIAVLIIIIMIMQQCGERTKIVYVDKNHYKIDTVTTTQIIRDTTRIISKVYVPVAGETVYVPAPANVDTAKILADYYAKRPYRDTLQNDSSAFIIVKDTISQNKIYSRQYEFVNNRPTQIINNHYTYIENKPFNLHFGGFVGGYPAVYRNDIPQNTYYGVIGASIMVTTNKHSSYGIQYDPFNKIGQFNIHWNIK